MGNFVSVIRCRHYSCHHLMPVFVFPTSFHDTSCLFRGYISLVRFPTAVEEARSLGLGWITDVEPWPDKSMWTRSTSTLETNISIHSVRSATWLGKGPTCPLHPLHQMGKAAAGADSRWTSQHQECYSPSDPSVRGMYLYHPAILRLCMP